MTVSACLLTCSCLLLFEHFNIREAPLAATSVDTAYQCYQEYTGCNQVYCRRVDHIIMLSVAPAAPAAALLRILQPGRLMRQYRNASGTVQYVKSLPVDWEGSLRSSRFQTWARSPRIRDHQDRILTEGSRVRILNPLQARPKRNILHAAPVGQAPHKLPFFSSGASSDPGWIGRPVRCRGLAQPSCNHHSDLATRPLSGAHLLSACYRKQRGA